MLERERVNKNVPKEYKSYVVKKYLGNNINHLKRGSESCPSYIKFKQMEEFLKM